MKVVIQTQIRENYGDADKPYWKFKGGDVYIVPNLTTVQAAKVTECGIPTLKALIENRCDMFEEYVVDYNVLEDDATVCEPWETPFNLYWEQGRWVARRTTLNDEYGYMRAEVASKSEEYEMGMGGEMNKFKLFYTMRNGDVVKGDEVEAYLTA